MDRTLIPLMLILIPIYPVFLGFFLAAGFRLILSRLSPPWIWLVPIAMLGLTIGGALMQEPPPDGPNALQKAELVLLMPLM
ncbi:MAG: hypothetical protein ABJD11_14920 [Gemmatimonadota bacterium]